MTRLTATKSAPFARRSARSAAALSKPSPTRRWWPSPRRRRDAK